MTGPRLFLSGLLKGGERRLPYLVEPLSGEALHAGGVRPVQPAEQTLEGSRGVLTPDVPQRPHRREDLSPLARASQIALLDPLAEKRGKQPHGRLLAAEPVDPYRRMVEAPVRQQPPGEAVRVDRAQHVSCSRDDLAVVAGDEFVQEVRVPCGLGDLSQRAERGYPDLGAVSPPVTRQTKERHAGAFAPELPQTLDRHYPVLERGVLERVEQILHVAARYRPLDITTKVTPLIQLFSCSPLGRL